MRFHPILSLGLGELKPTNMMCRSLCLNPLTTSKTKIAVIDVNSDLTATSSQKTSNLEPF
jgi:hypothetical protein